MTRKLALAALVLAGVSLCCACEPKLNAGDLRCSEDAAAPPAPDDPISMPWSTGFENRFCDYSAYGGFCYPSGSFSIVSTEHYEGHYAAAFHVNADDPATNQTRCVRQGQLPQRAYYSAWYKVPAEAVTTGNWNLWYFQGGADSSSALHNLWNVTLINGSNGALELLCYTPLNGGKIFPAQPPTIPIGTWFHIELLLDRAKDRTGEAALYLDGAQVFDEKNLITDDTTYGQWYVGNLADELTPPESTLYVDEVSIRATRAQ